MDTPDMLLKPAPPSSLIQESSKRKEERARQSKGKEAVSLNARSKKNGVLPDVHCTGNGHALDVDGHALMSSFSKMNGGLGIRAGA
eukprot:1162140-Pelagomonas_calceolata.AAC.3